MRKKPFVKPLIDQSINENVVNTMSFEDSVVDLSERLKSKQIESIVAADDVKSGSEIIEEKVAQDSEGGKSELGEEGADVDGAEFETDFDKFKDVASGKLGEFMDNPEQFTEIVLKFGDLIRTFFYPSIYSRIIFNSQEKIDCEVMLRNRASALSKNEAYEFNNYELELWGKVQKLNDHKSKIPFTDTEVKWLAKILSKRLESVPLAVMLEKYDWVLALLYIEGKRFLPVGQDRVANMFFSNIGK